VIFMIQIKSAAACSPNARKYTLDLPARQHLLAADARISGSDASPPPLRPRSAHSSPDRSVATHPPRPLNSASVPGRQVLPLGFMRGRTFSNVFVIADEMQNSTPEQVGLCPPLGK
jgi:hypothetical protein